MKTAILIDSSLANAEGSSRALDFGQDLCQGLEELALLEHLEDHFGSLNAVCISCSPNDASGLAFELGKTLEQNDGAAVIVLPTDAQFSDRLRKIATDAEVDVIQPMVYDNSERIRGPIDFIWLLEPSTT